MYDIWLCMRNKRFDSFRFCRLNFVPHWICCVCVCIDRFALQIRKEKGTFNALKDPKHNADEPITIPSWTFRLRHLISWQWRRQNYEKNKWINDMILRSQEFIRCLFCWSCEWKGPLSSFQVAALCAVCAISVNFFWILSFESSTICDYINREISWQKLWIVT